MLRAESRRQNNAETCDEEAIRRIATAKPGMAMRSNGAVCNELLGHSSAL